MPWRSLAIMKCVKLITSAALEGEGQGCAKFWRWPQKSQGRRNPGGCVQVRSQQTSVKKGSPSGILQSKKPTIEALLSLEETILHMRFAKRRFLVYSAGAALVGGTLFYATLLQQQAAASGSGPCHATAAVSAILGGPFAPPCLAVAGDADNSRGPLHRRALWAAERQQQDQGVSHHDRKKSDAQIPLSTADHKSFLPTFNLTIVTIAATDSRSFRTDEWAKFSQTALNNKQRYCDYRPEASCHFVTTSLDPTRNPKWSKIRALVGQMELVLSSSAGRGFSDEGASWWLWQLDLDTLITNHSISIADIFSEHGIDPFTGLVRGRPELGQTNLVSTMDCNSMNSGSLLWRVSPSTLMALRMLYQTYYAEVPGLIIEEQPGPDGLNVTEMGRASPTGQPSVLERQLALLKSPIAAETGCQDVRDGKPGAKCDIDLLISLLADEEMAAWYRAVAEHETELAIERMDRRAPTFLDPKSAPLSLRHTPLTPRKDPFPAFHDQASIRHLLSTSLPLFGTNHTVFIPQHKINAYPSSLATKCRAGQHSSLLTTWDQAGRKWRRGDLVAHLPSCRSLKLGADAFEQGKPLTMQDRVWMEHEKSRNYCNFWVESWDKWYGFDGIQASEAKKRTVESR